MPTINIAGQVNMIAWEGKRISIWETFDMGNGKQAFRLWTCWFSEPTQLQEEDWAEVTGELSTKIGEYIPKGETLPKPVVEHHVQNAMLLNYKSKAEQDAHAAQLEDAPF